LYKATTPTEAIIGQVSAYYTHQQHAQAIRQYDGAVRSRVIRALLNVAQHFSLPASKNAQQRNSTVRGGMILYTEQKTHLKYTVGVIDLTSPEWQHSLVKELLLMQLLPK
jgi:hypothetical protein